MTERNDKEKEPRYRHVPGGPDGDPVMDFLEDHGYVMMYEEYKPGLPEQFESAEGFKVIRTGPIQEWVTNHPLGENRKIQIAAMFIYDSKRWVTQVEHFGEIDYDRYQKRAQDLEAQGYRMVPSSRDRIVSYKALLQS